jgi:hypothetical protein
MKAIASKVLRKVISRHFLQRNPQEIGNVLFTLYQTVFDFRDFKGFCQGQEFFFRKFLKF